MTIHRATTEPRTRIVMTRALVIALRRVVAQPGGLVFAAVFYVMVTGILSGVWRVAAEVSGGEVVGYSAVALVWYIATSEAATIALPLRLIDDIGGDIGSGRFDTELLRPVSPLALRMATEVGQMLPRLAACISAGIALAWVVGGAPISGTALGLALPSLLLAVVTNLLAQHAFAAASFWILDARGMWFLYTKLVFVLGGMLLPLEVLPDGVAIVARFLPFAAMAYAPARLASGHVEPELLLFQLFWLLVMAAVARRAFAAGEAHLIEASP